MMPVKPRIKTYQGQACERCGESAKFTAMRSCVECAGAASKKYYTKNKQKWKIKALDSEYRKRKAEYARRYRQTIKGKEVNRIGQSKAKAKRLNAEGFHTTQEWIDPKNKYDNRCLCCGRHESELKSVLEEDHVIPLSRSGTNWINNIQPLCEDCNGMGGKGTKSTDFRSCGVSN
jgi:5-methylcytosine-specific restriction endonuclease McrA